MMTEMEEFLKILLSLSFSGTFLFLIVFLVVQMYRNRLSRRWQYYIWLLVVFRFLIPLTFPHTVTGYLFQGVEQAVAGRNAADAVENAVRKDIQESAVDEMEDASADAAAGIADDSKENVGGQGTAPVADTASDVLTVSFQEAADSRHMPAFSFWVFGIWAVGAFGLLVRKITIYQSYMQFLRKGNVEVSDIETLNILAEAEEKLRIKRAIGLYRNPLVTSPIMTGFIRPKIVIPDKKMTNGELACIFAHELVHFKYFDMLYKWLVQITICVHWFNPFVWLLGKEVNKHCELSCDEKVIGALNEQERKNYGDTLLSFLKRGETYQSPLASITLTEGAEQLIERLGAIMDYQKKTRTIMILTTVLTVLLCFFFSGIGAYAGARTGQQSVVQKNGLVQQNAEQQDIDYDLLYDEEAHSYYILIDGATPADRPIGGTTGGIGIVLVRKSGYTSFTFNSLSVNFGFLDEVESQCEDALEQGMISEAEAELILDVAVAIEEGTDLP
ncbi:MAG: M56 family metallopeptidase, partial [Lachnospiraceae bacterium]|nr:M56 family metallopeptidase [Lachnospiraceae bacterium]